VLIHNPDLDYMVALRARLLALGSFAPEPCPLHGLKPEDVRPDDLYCWEAYFGKRERNTQWCLRGTFGGHLNHPGLEYSARNVKEHRIGVFRGEQQIGTYERDYGTLFDTFEAFRWHGQDYALYSHDYEHTSAMSLPDCLEIAAEPEGQRGFCPTGYWVPISPMTGEALGFGFVCGCIWGDDTSWKIQFLDLRELREGIIRNDCRFGYLELKSQRSLKDSLKLRWHWSDREERLLPHHSVTITHDEAFRLSDGESWHREMGTPAARERSSEARSELLSVASVIG
jgi:hypothetical protein